LCPAYEVNANKKVMALGEGDGSRRVRGLYFGSKDWCFGRPDSRKVPEALAQERP